MERILRGVISTRHQRKFVSGLNYTARQARSNTLGKKEMRELPEPEFEGTWNGKYHLRRVHLKPRHWQIRSGGYFGVFPPGIKLKYAFKYTAMELCSTLGKKEMRVLGARSWRCLKRKVPSAPWPPFFKKKKNYTFLYIWVFVHENSIFQLKKGRPGKIAHKVTTEILAERLSNSTEEWIKKFW